MNIHLERGLTFLHGALTFFGKGIAELWTVAMGHKTISALVAVAIVGGTVGASYFFGGTVPSSATDERRHVTLLTKDELSAPEPLSLIGEVRSVSEALVAADSSGSVERVYRSLGDFVGAGAVIAELKNASQRAAVAQATAALEKVKSGVAVTGIGADSAQNALVAAQESAKNTITGGYSTIDDAVHNKADGPFSNPDGSPIFFVSTSNSQAVLTATSNRLAVQNVLKREASAGTPSITTEGLIAEMQTLSVEATQVRDFISSVISALNNAVSNTAVSEATIATYRANASTALANVNALRSSLNTAIENLKAKESAVAVAEENLAGGNVSGNPDIRSAEANLAAAEANLEKTIIRAPISGTINRLDLDVGSFVSASLPIVYITNARGLEAVVFVSERDIRDIRAGAEATIGGSIAGKVTRVATALDPITKKAEIRISIPETARLVSGSSVSLSIKRALPTAQNAGPVTIPLSALKITPEGPIVFTVQESKLVSHPVITGTLRGSKVEIKDGIADGMEIVADARGLSEGQEVIIGE